MSFLKAAIQEFESEAATTRRVLERIPDDKFSWKPHPKSMSMGELASHIAELSDWVEGSIVADEFDMHPPGGEMMKTPVFTTNADLLKAYDANVAKAKAALAGTDDAKLLEIWKLKKGGESIMEMPREVVIRYWVLNHMAHHRGQMSVYLRLNDIPVPSIYGPSADEGSM